jgi:hypothetical protein
MLSGDSAGAASAYASAIDVLHGTREDLRSARLHRKAAQAHVMQHDTDQAQAHLRTAVALLGRTPDVAETGRVLGARANWLWEVGRFGQAQEAAEDSLATAQRHGTSDDDMREWAARRAGGQPARPRGCGCSRHRGHQRRCARLGRQPHVIISQDDRSCRPQAIPIPSPRRLGMACHSPRRPDHQGDRFRRGTSEYENGHIRGAGGWNERRILRCEYDRVRSGAGRVRPGRSVADPTAARPPASRGRSLGGPPDQRPAPDIGQQVNVRARLPTGRPSASTRFACTSAGFLSFARGSCDTRGVRRGRRQRGRRARVASHQPLRFAGLSWLTARTGGMLVPTNHRRVHPTCC